MTPLEIVTSSRYGLSFLAFLGIVNVYMMRINLGVALVAMVKPLPDNETGASSCPKHSSSTNSSGISPGGEEFYWNRDLQGLILGSFFYGYIFPQVPAGWLAGVYGGKKIFGIGVLCTAIFTLLTPVVAKWNVNLFIVIRILEGLAELILLAIIIAASGTFRMQILSPPHFLGWHSTGEPLSRITDLSHRYGGAELMNRAEKKAVVFPAMAALWAHWAPPLERSRLQVFAYSGAEFGTVVGLPLAGAITDSLGWQYVFYIFGAVAMLWFIVWMLVVHDTPDDHPRISPEEKAYIKSSLETTSRVSVPLSDMPWKGILTSKPLWALSIAHFSHNWGFYTLLTCLPTYMRDVLGFDISQNSGLSALPYVFSTIFAMFVSAVVDAIRQRQILSTGAARKWANSIGLMGPAVCLVATGFVGCDYTLAVVLLCIAGATDGISMSGYNVNHLDIAPKYAGVLMGITNTIGTIPGFLGPQIVGWLTDKESTAEEWRNVFYISAEVYLFGTIIYCLYGSGTVQEWAKDNSEQELLHSGEEPKIQET